jgi:nucleolar protein 4
MEEGTKDPRTVFIKGVSFDWDNAEFEKAFSDVGPVRKCFLLKGAGKNHKVPPQHHPLHCFYGYV